jgi:hypothetical protein
VVVRQLPEWVRSTNVMEVARVGIIDQPHPNEKLSAAQTSSIRRMLKLATRRPNRA